MQYTKLLLLAFAIPVFACGGEEEDGDTTPPASGAAQGYLRVLHLGSDAPPVDIFVDGGDSAAIAGLAFGRSTDYVALPAGPHDFDVSAAGTPRTAAVLSPRGVALAQDTRYTVAAIGMLSGIRAIVLEDLTSNIPSGSIRVRAIHAAAGVGTVDLYSVTSSGETRIASGVELGASTGTLDLPAGAYTVGIDVDRNGASDLTFALPALAAGTYANVYAAKDDRGTVFLQAQLAGSMTARIEGMAVSQPPPGDDDDDDVTMPPPPENANIRVLHLSGDAPPVDVFVNDGQMPAVAGLAFPNGTPYVQLPAGQYDFAVSASGSPSSAAVLRVDNATLTANTSTTVAAFDRLAAPIRALALADDRTPPASGNIRIRAIHAAPDVGEVDIWNVTPGTTPAPIYENVPFGAAGNALELPAAAYRIGFDVDNDANPDLGFSIPALPAGTIANVFAVSAAGAVFLLAQLDDGTTVRIDPS